MTKTTITLASEIAMLESHITKQETKLTMKESNIMMQIPPITKLVSQIAMEMPESQPTRMSSKIMLSQINHDIESQVKQFFH